MAGNSNLHAANRAKKDEFYTQLSDIANELKHYRPHFAGKTVFCNCDDPYESNFFKYFALNFNSLGLKKLICTCYNGSPVAGSQLCLTDPEDPQGKQQKTRVPHKIVITQVPDVNGDGATDLTDVELLLKNNSNILTTLNGNGDFRSAECIELLKEADIVVTNPPFSLFREYVAQLVEYKKQFLIIGNQNAITYKEIFRLIKDNIMWLGSTLSFCAFKVPQDYEEKAVRFWIDETGQKWRSMGNICWFTNLDHKKRHEELDMFKHYSPDDYSRYDNFDAIEVSRIENIPMDYNGVMGVPITFLGKYNPDQFDIIGAMTTTKIEGYNYGYPYVNGQKIYARILIRKKTIII
ncbi:MAG: adenine-specific methyltransferase EcoRI family protein [Bacteroidaceae bacterium]|nr:adenine-specific methyltransferase EcoRI family protein [Bacteroidaceae bacterium]